MNVNSECKQLTNVYKYKPLIDVNSEKMWANMKN